MAHPKVEAALAAAVAAQARAVQATRLEARINVLTTRLSCLNQFSRIVMVTLEGGAHYTVPLSPNPELGTAIGQVLLDAYEAELSDLREKLESL